MKLTEYLNGMRAATTTAELEAALKVQYPHGYRGATWSRICKVRIEAGLRICDAHPLGRYVPRYDARRRLMLNGETYGVARGANSTGVRYAWHDACEWAKAILAREGFSNRAAYQIWEAFAGYPHRALQIVENAKAGKIPDPELHVLIRHERGPGSSPIGYSVERNDADDGDRRATKPCPCGGTLFDWGAGYSQGFTFVNWHCNECPDAYTEYMTTGELASLRQAHSRADRRMAVVQ